MLIRVGVIGTGYLGQHHARIYSEIPDAELVCLVDTDEKKAQDLAAKYCCKAYTDYRQAIKDCDAFSIVTPTVSHHEIALHCLSSGKDVLVEKPITASVSEADELINEAEQKGRILQVGHIERYNPAVQAAAGMIRKPFFLESKRLSPFTVRGTDVDITLDLMIHDIEIMLSIAGAPIREVRASGASVLTDRVDIAHAWLEFENNCTGYAEASRVSHERLRQLKIYQQGSYITVDYQNCAVTTHTINSAETSSVCIQPEKHDALKEELIDFIQCVKTRKRPVVSGAEARSALETALAITAKIKNS